MVYMAVVDYSLQDEGVKEHWDAPRYASHWDFPQFNKALIPYMIATNCEEVTIELNGKQFYVKKTSSYPNRMIIGYLPYIPGTVTWANERNIYRRPLFKGNQ
jgi:beta-galactosidase